MSKIYLFARKVGRGGTAVMETTIKDAVGVMKGNRRADYQLGILSGSNYSSLMKVYGEYAPFRRVSTVEDLVKSVEATI